MGTKKLKKGAVTTKKLKKGAVTTKKISDDAVTRAKLAKGSVSSGKIRQGAVKSGKLADAAVKTDKLAGGAVSTAKLANGAVTGAKVRDGSLSLTKVAQVVVNASPNVPSLVPGECDSADVAVAGARASDRVLAMPRGSGFNESLNLIAGPPGAGTVRISFCNFAGAATLSGNQPVTIALFR